MLKQKPPKAKACKVCRQRFQPTRAIQPCCTSYDCMLAYAQKVAARSAIARQKKEAREHREAKEKTKTRRDWMPEVQKVFNRFIRERDFDKPCISCGQYKDNPIYGTAWDCGHFLGVGARPDLRFDEKNAHKQCKSCNGGSGNYARKRHTVAQSYRINLIERIGLAEVERLEGPEVPKHYKIDDLKEIKRHYAQITKELLRQRDNV